MKVFYHINELGEQGYDILPVILQTCRKVKVWSPSASMMDSIYNKKVSLPNSPLLTSGDFLELLQDGHVQILGRKEWLTNHNSRKDRKWTYAKWNNEFDNKVRDYAIKDITNQTYSEKRVVLFDEEEGYAWADKIIGNQDEISKGKINFIRDLLVENQFPLGINEQLKRCENEAEKIHLILRMAYNHIDALNKSKANKTIDSRFWEKVSCGLCGNEFQHLFFKSADHFKNQKFIEILDFLKSITKPRNAEEIKKFRNSKNSALVFDEIERMLDLDIPASSILSSESRDNLDRMPSFIETLVPKGLLDSGITLLGVIFTLATFQFNPISYSGIILSLLPQFRNIASKNSILPAKDYTGFISPFLLAHDTGSPTYKQMEEMLDRFKEIKIN